MADVKEKLIEVLRNKPYGYSTYEEFADYLIANGVTVQIKKERPPTDLRGKCGSCRYADPAPGAFGAGK